MFCWFYGLIGILEVIIKLFVILSESEESSACDINLDKHSDDLSIL